MFPVPFCLALGEDRRALEGRGRQCKKSRAVLSETGRVCGKQKKGRTEISEALLKKGITTSFQSSDILSSARS